MKIKIEEIKSIKILKARNGIALIAVLAILLVLTLLVPTMFSMSEIATRESMKGTARQKASYLARTMCEMTVSAFEDFYSDANADGAQTSPEYASYLTFINNTKISNAQKLYWYINAEDEPSDPAAAATYDPTRINAEGDKEGTNTFYSTNPDLSDGDLFGEADCVIRYDDSIKYYIILDDGGTYEMFVQNYANGRPDNEHTFYLEYANRTAAEKDEKFKQLQEAAVQAIKDRQDYSTEYMRVTNRNVEFLATATVQGKTETRKCMLILPTKPDEQNWVVPASLGSNQVFTDTSMASGILPINMAALEGLGSGDQYVHQPMYIFSCLGNMILSFDNLPDIDNNGDIIYVDEAGNVVPEGTPGSKPRSLYYSWPSIKSELSLGVRPEVQTILPENDYTFSCLKGVNMASWYGDSQQDNFVAFTATNAIQVEVPVNLMVNPCRADRLGDGIDLISDNKNRSLYKVMVFQAPDVVFKDKVSTFVSFYTPPVAKNSDAHRMSTIILNAPDNTPYSYLNADRSETVKAGKVVFCEDVYIWVVPFGENGTGYSEHWYEVNSTVYYRDKDMILYKFADAGDVYYFNSEITMELQNKGQGSSIDFINKWNTFWGHSQTGTGQNVKTGFSLTSYFIDVIYRKNFSSLTSVAWYNVWGKIKEQLYKSYFTSDSYEATYVKDDLKYVGNIYSDANVDVPNVDDYYVIWDS